MKDAKAEKIKDNIVLSIRYQRLKEEIKDAETKRTDISEKKKILGSNEKQIDMQNRCIGEAQAAIKKIEKNNSPAAYSIIAKNQLNDHLKNLAKHKNFDLIKHIIAIELLSDDEFQYSDTTTAGFFENISYALFENKSVIKKMEEDYKKISTRIYGGGIISLIGSFAKSAANSLFAGKNQNNTSDDGEKQASAGASIQKKALAFVGVAGMGIGLGLKFIKHKGEKNKLRVLSPGVLAKKLIFVAMNLLYAEKHYQSEVEYKKYFESVLSEVNNERKAIMKEMFEDQYEMDANKLKIELLHNFDNYMIDKMCQKTKEVKKSV